MQQRSDSLQQEMERPKGFMMKKYIPYVLILVVGFVIGILCRPNHFRDTTDMVKDTLVIYDTARYSKLELASKSYRLSVPKIERPSLVYIPADSTTIIYRDSIRYVTLPRQYFFTSTDDVEIWHSGIDSTIDSLNVVRKTQEITKVTQSVTNRNALGIGLDMNYSSHPDIPIYLEYSYLLHRNVEMSARLQYDLPSQEIGFGLGAKISIGW
jgi:hypothetical protein